MAFLLRRHAVYHFRCRVPADLLDRFGRAEVKRSLATADYRTARSAGAQCYVAAQAFFERVRRGAMEDLDKDGLIAALSTALSDSTKQLQDMAAALDTITREYTALNDRHVGLMERHAAYVSEAEPERLHDARAIQAVADALEKLDGERAELLEERDRVEKAGKIEQANETIAKLGDLLGSLGVTMKSTPAPKATVFLDGTYAQEKRLQDDSNRHITNYVRLFARVTGDKPLNTYERGDVLRWVRTLERLKNSLGKSPSDETKTIAQLLVESEGKPTMNETTIGKHIMHVKALFKSAIKHHRFAQETDVDSMFDDIDLSEWVPKARKRKSWQMKQLTALFSSPIWSGTRSRPEDVSKRNQPGPHIHRDAYWWLPVAALWTGGRLEELAQLHHSDLGHDSNGTPFLKINDEGPKRTKNEHSIRNVPVHPFLSEIGFLDLFRPGSRNGRIFPELKPTGRMGKLGETYSTHFTDYRRRCDLYEPLRDFHSLRRTFITTLRSKYNIHPLTVAAIAGHDEEFPELQRVQQTDDYTDYDISDLARAVAVIDYEGLGVDVSHLRKKP